MTEGDIGVPIGVDTGMDLSGAENITLYFRHKNGSGNFPNAVADGQNVVYTTQEAADIPVGSGGEWKLQGEFTLAGKTVRTPWATVIIDKQL